MLFLRSLHQLRLLIQLHSFDIPPSQVWLFFPLFFFFFRIVPSLRSEVNLVELSIRTLADAGCVSSSQGPCCSSCLRADGGPPAHRDWVRTTDTDALLLRRNLLVPR